MTKTSRNSPKIQSQVADVAFVISEIHRFAAMTLEEIRSLSRHDLASELPHPSGHGRLFCGQAAAERIEDLVDRQLAGHPLSGRVASSEVVSHFGDELIRRFVAEGKQVDEQQVAEALTAAIDRAAVVCADTVHYVPCHLSWVASPESFSIGPVRFRPCHKFIEDLRIGLNKYVGELSEKAEANIGALSKESESKFRGRLRDEAVHYYEGFKWVADVEIRGCDAETSLQRALFAVSSAVDVLHLLLGAYFSNRMHIGGPRLAADQRARITRGADDTVDVLISREPVGQVLEDNWWEIISAGDGEYYLSVAGESLEVATDPQLVRPLSYRFLEALSWFGQAVGEVSDAARVVKYVTSIERMVQTGENDVSKTVTNRCAALCWEPGNRDLNWWRNEIGRAYDLRSGLVHGVIPPFDARVAIGAHACERIARLALIRGLSFFHHLGLHIVDISQKQLRKSYHEHVEKVFKLQRDAAAS